MTVLTLVFHNPSASPNKQKKKNGFSLQHQSVVRLQNSVLQV